MSATLSPLCAAHANRPATVSLQGDARGLPFRSLRPATMDDRLRGPENLLSDSVYIIPNRRAFKRVTPLCCGFLQLDPQGKDLDGWSKSGPDETWAFNACSVPSCR